MYDDKNYDLKKIKKALSLLSRDDAFVTLLWVFFAHLCAKLFVNKTEISNVSLAALITNVKIKMIPVPASLDV